jgi:hypothetical protein
MSKSAKPSDRVTEDSMGFKDQYVLALQVYSKIIGVIYKDTAHNPRANKVGLASFQFGLILLMTGILSLMAELDKGAAIVVTLIIVRFAQILFNLMISSSPIRDEAKCRNILVGILIKLCMIGCNVVSIRVVSMDKTQEEIDMWKEAFIITFIVEIFVFDLLVIPLTITSALTCCCVRSARKTLNPALSLIKRNTKW